MYCTAPVDDALNWHARRKIVVGSLYVQRSVMFLNIEVCGMHIVVMIAIQYSEFINSLFIETKCSITER